MKLTKYISIYWFILVSGNTLYSQKCEPLKKSVHQKEYGASGNNTCCVDSAIAADVQLKQISNIDSIVNVHSPFGVPVNKRKSQILLVNQTYLIGYDTILRIPMWVQYKLGESNKVGRTDCFRYDPRIKNSLQASYNDYQNTENFQRGHLKPSSDGQENFTGNLNTFIMTNMVPQYGELNQCTWQIVEDLITKHSKSKDVKDAFVISGCIVNNDSKWLNEKIVIPDAFYKIYYFIDTNSVWHYWTFYLDHTNDLMEYDQYQNYLMENRKTIREIEELSKVNFSVCTKGQREKVETHLDNTFSLKTLKKYPGWCKKYLKKE